mmetsp:Transcript_5597/g.15650  ORF Transcript_5597/g.15650 Transcript_5597/m.15650 type:complete len:314 (+) Transcript_5597:161-1102(+)
MLGTLVDEPLVSHVGPQHRTPLLGRHPDAHVVAAGRLDAREEGRPARHRTLQIHQHRCESLELQCLPAAALEEELPPLLTPGPGVVMRPEMVALVVQERSGHLQLLHGHPQAVSYARHQWVQQLTGRQTSADERSADGVGLHFAVAGDGRPHAVGLVLEVPEAPLLDGLDPLGRHELVHHIHRQLSQTRHTRHLPALREPLDAACIPVGICMVGVGRGVAEQEPMQLLAAVESCPGGVCCLCGGHGAGRWLWGGAGGGRPGIGGRPAGHLRSPLRAMNAAELGHRQTVRGRRGRSTCKKGSEAMDAAEEKRPR